MIWGIHISRCVYAVAELGIADLLAHGPRSSQELATTTGTHEPSLYRVLRVLTALGVFEEHTGPTLQPHVGGRTPAHRGDRRDALLGDVHRGRRRRAPLRPHP